MIVTGLTVVGTVVVFVFVLLLWLIFLLLLSLVSFFTCGLLESFVIHMHSCLKEIDGQCVSVFFYVVYYFVCILL